jgi:hypothetical protein
MVRHLALLTCGLAVALISPAAAADEGPIVVSNVNVNFALDAVLSPQELPADRRAPAALVFATRISTVDDGPPPPLSRFVLETDEQLAFDFGDIPECSGAAMREISFDNDPCERAIVGRGSTNFQHAFAARMPSAETGSTTIYNGGLVHGIRRLWLRRTLSYPTERLILFPLEIKNSRPPFRRRLVLSPPRVAGGSGTLMSLSLRLDAGVFARCLDGKIRFRMAGVFADRSHLGGRFSRRCTPA